MAKAATSAKTVKAKMSEARIMTRKRKSREQSPMVSVPEEAMDDIDLTQANMIVHKIKREHNLVSLLW
ncbi:hypothetical protein GGF31_000279 [Allomyces arbusculus]|nr:hypothetical protein GGF31_000279 [Allomyces arbusculus]